jgi:hypothetical protein
MGRKISTWKHSLLAPATIFLECAHRPSSRQTSENLHSSTTYDSGCLSLFPARYPSRAVSSCGSSDLDLFMVYACMYSETFCSCCSSILEQHISGRADRTQWSSSMAFSFIRFKYIRFSSLGIATDYCLFY